MSPPSVVRSRAHRTAQPRRARSKGGGKPSIRRPAPGSGHSRIVARQSSCCPRRSEPMAAVAPSVCACAPAHRRVSGLYAAVPYPENRGDCRSDVLLASRASDSMRFRPATEADVPALVSRFRGRNALPLEPRVRAALPGLLRQLVASPASTLTLFEERQDAGLELISFAGGVFLRDEVIEQYLAHPFPALLSSVLAALLDNSRPLLTLDEIRQANCDGGLTLAVFPMTMGALTWDSPVVADLRKLAPQAFVRYYAGFRLKAIYYEVFADEVADYLRAGGYRMLHDFSTAAGTGFLSADCRPHMMRLTRAELPPGAMSMATQMFDPPAARLGLTPAEQRVVLHALDGASDRE